MMTIEDVRWEPATNVMVVRCDCGTSIEHRADRWTVRCPACCRTANLADVREAWVERHRRAAADASE